MKEPKKKRAYLFNGLTPPAESPCNSLIRFETAAHETAAHETAAHETAAHETAAHETAAHETAAHETAAHEILLKTNHDKHDKPVFFFNNKPMSKKHSWEKLSDDEILDLKFCDLDLSIEGSRIEPLVDQLYKELKQKKIHFRPEVYIAEDWFSFDGVPGIAVPFYVVNNRLAKIQKKLLLDAEGYNKKDCMKLLRHEAGHAIDNAFYLRKSKSRQKLFGLSSTPYPNEYSPHAYSRKYVIHLNLWYAQAHPDEDWAESFALWLTPRSNWRKKYQKWPAIKKLQLVNELMKEIAYKSPLVKIQEQPGNIKKNRRKLKTFYKNKIDELSLSRSFSMVPLIAGLFSTDSKYKNKKLAAQFIKQERKPIRNMVARWTGLHKYTINEILEDIILNCQEEKLRLMTSEREARLDLVGMLTAHTLNCINSGHHKIPM